MIYKIVFTEAYRKKASKFLKQHPGLKERHKKVIELLKMNPLHPSLRLHSLKGSMKGLFSVSINMSYRISIEFIIEEKTIIPVNIGDHDDIYS